MAWRTLDRESVRRTNNSGKGRLLRGLFRGNVEETIPIEFSLDWVQDLDQLNGRVRKLPGTQGNLIAKLFKELEGVPCVSSSVRRGKAEDVSHVEDSFSYLDYRDKSLGAFINTTVLPTGSKRKDAEYKYATYSEKNEPTTIKAKPLFAVTACDQLRSHSEMSAEALDLAKRNTSLSARTTASTPALVPGAPDHVETRRSRAGRGSVNQKLTVAVAITWIGHPGVKFTSSQPSNSAPAPTARVASGHDAGPVSP